MIKGWARKMSEGGRVNVGFMVVRAPSPKMADHIWSFHGYWTTLQGLEVTCPYLNL